VVVSKAAGKSASVHDLHRAFGTRWAEGVVPAILRRLMRYSAVETTMSYYVDLDASEVVAPLWADFGNTPAADNSSDNPAQETQTPTVSAGVVTSCRKAR
jgi:hypothetical protein